jgi:Putative transposase/Transposase zinc-binding domain
VARLCALPTYHRRQPEGSVLHRTLQAHLDTFLTRTAGDEGGGLPSFVIRELRAYLRCGLLEHGCVHVRCPRCADEMVVAFSCKGRGVCPSCGGRRMSALAAQLVEQVIPHVPARQWVLSLPWSLRYQLAFNAALCGDVLSVFLHGVFGWLAASAARHRLRQPRCGAVTAIQRFWSALNLNLHLHSLVLDGVYTRPSQDAAPVFHPLPPPTDEEIGTILERVHAGVQTLLRRRGRLPEEPSPSDPLAEQMPLLAAYAAASIQDRVAAGPRAGHPVRRLRSAAAVVDGAKPRCARLEGFSLHANVALPAHAREQLEHLCRYLLRPPLALERLTESSGGQLLYELLHPRRDGATHLVLDPLELIEKLSVLIPAPRFHLLRFHALLASHAARRSSPASASRSTRAPGPSRSASTAARATGPRWRRGPQASRGRPC